MGYVSFSLLWVKQGLLTRCHVGWAIPFLFMVIWGLITMRHAKKEIHLEREEWENDNGWESVAHGKMHAEKAEKAANAANGVPGSNDSSTLDTRAEQDLEASRAN